MHDLVFSLQPMDGESPWRGLEAKRADYQGRLQDGRFVLSGMWRIPEGNTAPTHINIYLDGHVVTRCPITDGEARRAILGARWLVTFDCPVDVNGSWSICDLPATAAFGAR